VKADDPNQYQQLPNSQNKATGGLSFMSDGRLVYASAEAGNQDVWTMDSNGVTKRLTFKEYTEAEPAVSGDGRYIFYVAYPKGTAHLWYMNADGTDQKPFTSGYLEDSPDCSSDNKWVVYHSEENYKDSLYRIPVEDGPPTKITDTTAIQPSISPDGKLVAYFSRDDNNVNSPWQLKISPIDGDTPVRTFSISSTVCPQCVGPRWTRDGQSITYVVTNSGVSNIWIQNLNEGPARALTNFNQEQIYSFAWSRDGRQLVCVRGSETRDVILVTNFK
jgi:Tol biopolymer transport system component